MKYAVEYDHMSPEQKLRACWSDFCDADPTPADFIEDMEKAGFLSLRSVTKADVEGDDFSHERGIVLGGTLWELTEAGRAALSKAGLPQ